MPESDQNRKKTDQEGFLRQRAAKLREQLSRQDRGNRQLEASLLMHELLSGGGWRMCDVGIEQAAELVRLAEMKLALVRNRVEREKARTAVEPPRQVVEQVVGMAVGPLIEFGKTPGQAVEQVVDMAEDPWIGFVLPPLQAVEQAVGTVEPEAEDETLNWLAEDPWIGFVLPPLQAVEQAVGTVEPEAEDETLNWLVEALNAGEIAPFAEALSCIDQEPWEENMAAAETEEEVDTLNWLVEAAGENAPSLEVGRQEDMALCCISVEAVDPWMEFVEKMFGAVPLSCFAPESVERDHPPWQAPCWKAL
ncbi:hypothetical protein ZIOFF_019274 [Zingiber officinale]|uniref:Uncharacterized protein n=1 Tax=Zingiber officinale TaxID=94328 RepID=A0A8J5HRE8_ZINOF|nr:hypothetical protein ZIOFF_019274 [Zingiber officinale]